MDDKQFRELAELIRGLRTEIMDVKLRVHELELHLRRQDKAGEEILAASRRLLVTIEAIDDETEHLHFPDGDEEPPLQN